MRRIVYADIDAPPAHLRDLVKECSFEWVSLAENLDNANGLFYRGGRLEMEDPQFRNPLFFDLQVRPQVGGHSKEPLKRAMGKGHLVWDATCGSGKDSLLLTQFGFAVLAFERDPILLLMLEDALELADKPFQLHAGCCSDYQEGSPDIIYYDPMYPEKKKKALPRKEMQIFQNLDLKFGDETELAEKFLSIATQRLVVKRPLSGKDLLPRPDARYKGKSVRYDMYLSRR